MLKVDDYGSGQWEWVTVVVGVGVNVVNIYIYIYRAEIGRQRQIKADKKGESMNPFAVNERKAVKSVEQQRLINEEYCWKQEKQQKRLCFENLHN